MRTVDLCAVTDEGPEEIKIIAQKLLAESEFLGYTVQYDRARELFAEDGMMTEFLRL